MIVGIVGGGASGMAAALAAAENSETNVLLFERQARLGRKLLATGNGRCNLTNMCSGKTGYHGNDSSFAVPALTAFSPADTRKWFQGLGLYTVAEPSGRVYPYSDQANSVVDVLRFALDRENIHQYLGFEVQTVRRKESGFLVECQERQIYCDRLIIACGGLAGTKLGGSMSGYRLLKKLGHSITALRPALVQIKSGWGGVAGLKGVRANCHAAILRDGVETASSTGELQFTEYGLSGPVIFEISRDVCHGGGDWSCRLDFLPDVSKEELLTELLRRKTTALPTSEILTGILHNRLGRVLTKAAGLPGGGMVRDIPQSEIYALRDRVKELVLPLTEPLGMDSAQVTAGGAVTADFDPDTMESYRVPGLYACGEVLDIDGDCGGYNLQWAWSSGRCAGLNAGKGRA